MATRFYVVPKIGTGIPEENNPYRAKYFHNALGSRVLTGETTGIPYGLEPFYIVAADVTAQEHTGLVANADVIAFPLNLDAAVGQNLATVTSKLDACGFPSDWVDASTTYRQILRMLTQQATFARRLFQQSNVRLLPVGVTLDTKIRDIPVQQLQRMKDAIAAFPGGTGSEITGAMSVRQALKLLADQVPFVASMLDTML